MKNQALLNIIVCILLSLYSCNNENKTISTAEKTKTQNKTVVKIEYGESIIVAKEDLVIYPLILNSGEYNSYESRSVNSNYWNIIFHNLKTNQSTLLTEQKMVIGNFRIGNSEIIEKDGSNVSQNFIYYEIINSDFNDDRKLTAEDQKKLFISTLEGKDLKQISPENYQLVNWKIDSLHGLILMQLTQDSDQNKKLDKNDSSVNFSYNLKTGAMATPIFDKNFEKKVTELAKQVL